MEKPIKLNKSSSLDSTLKVILPFAILIVLYISILSFKQDYSFYKNSIECVGKVTGTEHNIHVTNRRGLKDSCKLAISSSNKFKGTKSINANQNICKEQLGREINGFCYENRFVESRFNLMDIAAPVLLLNLMILPYVMIMYAKKQK